MGFAADRHRWNCCATSTASRRRASRRSFAAFRDLLDLDEFLETPVRQLSLGQRMRGDLAAALLHDPAILYLDEPTIGLDVVAKERIREFLLEINRERGVTVLLTTHDMADIAHLCARMMIIDHGQLLYDGSVQAIRDRFGDERTLVVDLEDGRSRSRSPACPPRSSRGRLAPLAPLPPRGGHGGGTDRRRLRPLPHPRPDDRGTGNRGHRAPHLQRRVED